jgi:3'(2'), 5'-bisphosphate nucleotidase
VTTPLAPELQAGLGAAARAGNVVLEHYRRFTAIPDARADISTQADRDSQEIILKLLHGRFPADSLCAEERTPSLALAPAGAPRTWIIDPIDGTRGFAKKNGEFSVMIALLAEGRIQIGVVFEPVAARLTYAVRGGGCWRKDQEDGMPQPCRVRAVQTLSQAVLTQSHTHSPGRQTRLASALAPARIQETYSAGLKLALVARGEAELYLNTYENFHDGDIAAGHLLVEEAGGQVTGLHGEPIRYGEASGQRSGLLASNGSLHRQALEVIRAADPAQ